MTTLWIFRYLRIDEDEKRAYLLGYDMCLTPTEFNILCAVAFEGGLGIDVIIGKCGLSDNVRGNVSVHVCGINRKAEKIGKRKLILYKDSKYYINEFM